MTTASTVTSIAMAIQRSRAASGCEISSTTAVGTHHGEATCRIASEFGQEGARHQGLPPVGQGDQRRERSGHEDGAAHGERAEHAEQVDGPSGQALAPMGQEPGHRERGEGDDPDAQPQA